MSKDLVNPLVYGESTVAQYAIDNESMTIPDSFVSFMKMLIADKLEQSFIDAMASMCVDWDRASLFDMFADLDVVAEKAAMRLIEGDTMARVAWEAIKLRSALHPSGNAEGQAHDRNINMVEAVSVAMRVKHGAML